MGLALAPLGWLYAGGMGARGALYRLGVLPRRWVGVPVVVVGNIAVGGTGKTPLVVWIARYLVSRGLTPGLVCRGYGGLATSWPQQVRPDSDPAVVGDEAVLLARRGGCPVAAGPDRVAAARALVAHSGCEVVVSDDGLQHLALARDVEIAVIDGARRHGNGRCLPAGPLREPLSRLARVDMVVCNGQARKGEFEMRLAPWRALAVGAPQHTRALEEFRATPIHAVAGIGHPERFFLMLEELGLQVIRHPFADHHVYEDADLEFGDGLPVLMTEKDEVKCARLPGPQRWYVPVRAELQAAFAARLDRLLAGHGLAPQEPGS